MRLGKEQAAGYVEDTGTDTDNDMIVAEELTTSEPERTELTPAPQPAPIAG
jgi:hypothetical protein